MPSNKAALNLRAALIRRRKGAPILAGALIIGLLQFPASGAETSAVSEFRKEISPILEEYCYDCHGDGSDKGGIAFDELSSDESLLDHDLWLKVLKNVRAGLMPPQKKEQPSTGQRQKLEQWIKYSAFGIDPRQPDPGRVTVRRLNRVEYRNTIKDLMGIDFDTEMEFPPDDTGYGFDNIGDVLTVSPMLLEKYLVAARVIVSDAVPNVSRVLREQIVPGDQFHPLDAPVDDSSKTENRRRRDLRLSYYEPASVSSNFSVDQAGTYRVVLTFEVDGGFDYDPGRCRVIFKLDGRELLRQEFGWYDNKTFNFEFDETWDPSEHRLTFEMEPLTPEDKKLNAITMRFDRVAVLGPLEKDAWVKPAHYDRFFPGDTPADPTARRDYGRQLLKTFASKAFRRPVDDRTADRLAVLAENVYSDPGKTFEEGIGHAMMAVLASPRFLFCLEEPAPAPPAATTADIDEYSLASRLSYFLWSTMPDEELITLAGRGELRTHLSTQVKRMLDDPRSDKMVQNFTGQWLQTRDVAGISINSQAILARDAGVERELREEQETRRARFAQFLKERAEAAERAKTNPVDQAAAPVQRPQFPKSNINLPKIELDRDLRNAMERETELFFANIVHEDRPVTELIDADYTFLNEKLANLYGITNVVGSEMRRVALAPGSPRGGVLTQGSALVVTSNPDRTSPVKRGLFILENFLGTPAPPPPANIPALEASEADFKDHEPTLREALALHREKPLCASCHNRMDPIGLAFENFNALGMWRDTERRQTIDAAGKLITGESFNSVSELKRILANDHRLDFYRCLTEKFLTYGLGRGPEYYDVETIDQIVRRLDHENGRFSALLMGVIESAPFQKMRLEATATTSTSDTLPREAPRAATQVANN